MAFAAWYGIQYPEIVSSRWSLAEAALTLANQSPSSDAIAYVSKAWILPQSLGWDRLEQSVY